MMFAGPRPQAEEDDGFMQHTMGGAKLQCNGLGALPSPNNSCVSWTCSRPIYMDVLG